MITNQYVFGKHYNDYGQENRNSTEKWVANNNYKI